MCLCVLVRIFLDAAAQFKISCMHDCIYADFYANIRHFSRNMVYYYQDLIFQNEIVLKNKAKDIVSISFRTKHVGFHKLMFKGNA